MKQYDTLCDSALANYGLVTAKSIKSLPMVGVLLLAGCATRRGRDERRRPPPPGLAAEGGA